MENHHFEGNVLEKVHDNEALHLVGENLEEERGRYEEDDLDVHSKFVTEKL